MSVAIAVAAWWLLEPSNMWITAASLPIARVVNRTIGPPAKPGDTLFLVAACSGITIAYGYVAVGAFMAIAFLVDGVMKPAHRKHLGAALVMVGVTVYALSRHDVALGQIPLWQIVIGTLPFGIVLQGDLTSVSDVGENPLDKTRVRVGAIITILFGGAAALLAADVSEVAVLFGANVAVIVGTIRRRFFL